MFRFVQDDAKAKYDETKADVSHKADVVKQQGKEYKYDAERTGDYGKAAIEGQYNKLKGEAQHAVDVTKASLFPSSPTLTHASILPYHPHLSRHDFTAVATRFRRPLNDVLTLSSFRSQDAAHQTAEKAKETSSGWFGWGAQKADDGKKESAKKVEQGAKKVETEAHKRT